MPNDIILSELTPPPAKASEEPIVSTQFGKRGGNRLPPNIALNFGGTSPGDILTITALNTANFGAQGPELVTFFDTESGVFGESLSPVLGPGTTQIDAGDFIIDEVLDMPNGKAWRVGTNGAGFNSTSVNRGRFATTQHRRGFELMTTYWPLANQINADATLTANLPTLGTWQTKAVWNMSDGDFGGADTDFFLNSWHSYYNGSGTFGAGGFILSSNSIPTRYVLDSEMPNRGFENRRMPIDEPMVIEFMYDQRSLTGLDGIFDVKWHCMESGDFGHKFIENQRLWVPNGPTKEINSYNYPGFIRGFNTSENAHYYEADFYKTCGPGACCRVAICDGPNYFQSRKRTVLLVESWSNGEITAKLRSGWFDLTNLSGNYICIIDKHNNQIVSRIID